MLVVTNGQSAVEAIGGAGITGVLLPWDDVLHDGPVPGGLSDEALAEVRAEFLSAGEDPARALDKLNTRDRTLKGWSGPITLWFEHDLYDQLQLIQVLARLSADDDVLLVPETTYIAMQEPGSLRAGFGRKSPVGEEHRRIARKCWDAFTSARPDVVHVLLDHPDIGALPHLAPALIRWFETFPDSGGLSRTERLVLELLARRPATGVELFRTAQAGEAAVFRGDWSFWLLLEGLSPDIISSSGDPLGTWELTGLGRDVLGGVDRVDAAGIDLWRGGTHLTASNDWRWTGEGMVRRS